jgi:hypothetical protein
VTIHTDGGDISITRPDGRVARMVRPGFPDREAALQRRSIEGLIAEELRRLDPDEVYGETLAALPDLAAWTSHSDSSSAATATAGGTAPARKAKAPAAKATKAATPKAVAPKAPARTSAAPGTKATARRKGSA